jgi:hypothetical protein
MSEHRIFAGVKGDTFTPRCATGWTGTTTRWSAIADRQAADHLKTEGAPAPKPAAHTYDAGRRHSWRHGA